MAEHFEIQKHTLTVRAFGETRELTINEFIWSSDERGVYDRRFDTQPVFCARLGRGVKLWQVNGHVRPSKDDPNVYELAARRVTILNRANGYIIGWWDEQRHGRSQSQHNSAIQWDITDNGWQRVRPNEAPEQGWTK